MTNRYGGANGRGRRISDYEDEAVDKGLRGNNRENVKKFDFERTARLYQSFGAKGNEALQRRAFQVGARADRGPKGQQQLMAHRSLSDMESSERHGVHRAGRRRGKDWEDIDDAIESRRSAQRRSFGKSRHYDPESRRQKRLGMAIAASGGVGGALAFRGGRGVVRSTQALAHLKATGVDGKNVAAGKEELKHLGSSIHARRNDVRDLGLGTAGLGSAAGLQTYSNSRRGRPWS